MIMAEAFSRARMPRKYAAAAALALLAATAGVASAQQATYSGSATAGREVALYNCDSCHVVAAKQELRPLVGNYAPSFFDIANKPTTTEASLRAFLSHNHAYGNMPYPDLTPRDLADVVAYILSLRGPH